MKRLIPAILLLITLMASCSNEKPYTIQGRIELPDSLLVGDSLMATPSLEGWQVYMLNLDGESIDSVQISDNQFSFEGMVNKKDPYFVYLASDLCVGLIAIEPGDIEVVIDAESLTATGTPTNDMMIDIDATLLNLQQDTYAEMAALTQEYGEAMPDSLIMPLYQDYMSKYNQVVDSFYQASPEGLAAVYCVNVLTSHAQSSAELMEALSEYPDEIQDSPLMQSRLAYLRSIESYYQMLEGQTQDTTSFSIEDLMRDAQISTPEAN